MNSKFGISKENTENCRESDSTTEAQTHEVNDKTQKKTRGKERYSKKKGQGETKNA